MRTPCLSPPTGVPAALRRPRERGTLLLDYFLAAALFSVTFGAFLTAVTARVRGLGMAERMVHATQAAESTLARLRAGVPVEKTFKVANVPGSEGIVTVKPTGEPDSALKRCAVIVKWTEPDGTQETVRLDSVLR